jgi:hypothetical protein
MSTSAVRMQRMRGHRNNEHSQCQYKTCQVRQRLELENEEHLEALALFAELAKRGVDALTFFGEDFDAFKERAERVLPEYEYLPEEPDFLNRMHAKGEVDDYLAGIPRMMLN